MHARCLELDDTVGYGLLDHLYSTGKCVHFVDYTRINWVPVMLPVMTRLYLY
jgi:hypothetical protein